MIDALTLVLSAGSILVWGTLAVLHWQGLRRTWRARRRGGPAMTRALSALALGSVFLIGLVVTLLSPQPVRVAIALTLAGAVAFLLAGLVILTMAAPLAPLLAALWVLYGPYGRAAGVATVAVTIAWPISLALVVSRWPLTATQTSPEGW